MLWIATLFCGSVDFHPIEIGGNRVHPTRLILKPSRMPLKGATPKFEGVTTLRWMPQIGRAVVECPPGTLQKRFESFEKLLGTGNVEYDRVAIPAYVPNDPQFPNMWHLPNMRVPQAWDRSLGSNSAIVAIMDTGVNDAHEDLVNNIWQNTDEIPGNGIDDDGNGYVDDLIGWDFVAGDAVPNDVNGHGTACAGIAAATGDNGIGVTGVAPRARIMCLKAAQDDGYFFLSNNLPAYFYAADNGAHVLSMSFFSDSLSPAEREAIDYVWSKGCLPVAAAGNDSTVYPYYPGAYANVLSVAAIGTNGSKAGFSDWGSWVDVAAPGVSIRTTVTSGGYTTGFAGTSAACPNVAGVAALLKGAKPNATVQELRNAIEDTAVSLVQSPFGEYTNYGLVQADAALNAILDGPARRRSPLFRYVSPIGVDATGQTVATIVGRSMDRDIRVFSERNRVPAIALGRDYRQVRLRSDTRTLWLWNGYDFLGEIRSPASSGWVYPLTEGASDSGGLVFGGFWETLNVDRSSMRVTRRSNGTIMLEGAFRNVHASGPKYLNVRRKYINATGTEAIQLYDWSSASYPYGTWVTIRDAAIPVGTSTFDANVADGHRFVDYEGTVYFRILTSSGLPADAELLVDCAFLK